jgi:hypothetical protein
MSDYISLYRHSLAEAMRTAIIAREKIEREEWRYTGDSCQLASWREFLLALDNRREVGAWQLKIREDEAR